MRNIKIVEMTVMDLIIEEMERIGCHPVPPRLTKSKAGIDLVKTQVWSRTKEELGNQNGRLVSVLLTDEKLKPEHRVTRTERVGVYDGIIRYKPEWIFVIENKPDHRNVWVEQLSSTFSESFDIEDKPVVLRWQEIITRISVLKENGLVQGSDASLLEDFLDFVSDQFPELNPYERFGLCKGDPYLLTRRCISIMEESKLGPVDYHRGWHYYIETADTPSIKEITIFPERLPDGEWEIRLELYPGDTINQARQFYSTLKLKEFAGLTQRSWEISPNLHFAFRSSNLVWTTVSCPLDQYLQYWQTEVKKGALRQMPRYEWNNYFRNLKLLRMLSEEDEPDLTKKIIDTGMQKINVCPGVGCRYKWTKSDAISLDDKGAFVLVFKEKVKECFDTWL
jgi:hypothetical protein